MATAPPTCIFCQIARSTSNTLLHQDDKFVAFQDINPSAFRHYLVIPVEHIPTVKDLKRSPEDFSLGDKMIMPYVKCWSKPITKRCTSCQALSGLWKAIKYFSLGPFGGFIEAEKLLDRIKPLSSL
ncbi:hypothetical protein OROMI_009096 [Orobanche minor]